MSGLCSLNYNHCVIEIFNNDKGTKMEQQIKSNGKSPKSEIRIKNESQQVIDESEIRQQMDNHIKALCDMDLDSIMTIYAPDILSFDVEGTYLRTEAKRKAWVNVFSMIEPPLDYEIRDLTITVGDDVAFSHSLNRLSGNLKHEQQIGSWVRYTACFRKIEGNWLITHEQVSMPIDFESGKAIFGLKP